MLFALALSVDEDVINVHYYENVELLCQDLVDIALDHGWSISQSEKHDLVIEVTIAGFEGRLLFVSFLDSHLMVGIGQIKLGKPSSLT